MGKDKLETICGYHITDFKKLNPPVKWGKATGRYALPDFIYEGMVDVPNYGPLTLQWTAEGRCPNYNRTDCFINIELAEEFLLLNQFNK